jgi:hypothetical protein
MGQPLAALVEIQYSAPLHLLAVEQGLGHLSREDRAELLLAVTAALVVAEVARLPVELVIPLWLAPRKAVMVAGLFIRPPTMAPVVVAERLLLELLAQQLPAATVVQERLLVFPAHL